uniref:Uncharacterized protein n=1 Tax=Medicago truncatula TaxID=3880 RepID=A2Q163_MEDTR|nr:hypothetical protein MtrDRAFT_AC147963g26v2 [Medicago truncatula]
MLFVSPSSSKHSIRFQKTVVSSIINLSPFTTTLQTSICKITGDYSYIHQYIHRASELFLQPRFYWEKISYLLSSIHTFNPRSLL